jgi:hypothetical protein
MIGKSTLCLRPGRWPHHTTFLVFLYCCEATVISRVWWSGKFGYHTNRRGLPTKSRSSCHIRSQNNLRRVRVHNSGSFAICKPGDSPLALDHPSEWAKRPLNFPGLFAGDQQLKGGCHGWFHLTRRLSQQLHLQDLAIAGSHCLYSSSITAPILEYLR